MARKRRLRRDFARLREVKGWSPARAFVDAVLLDTGFQALILHRLAHVCVRHRVPILPALCRSLSIALCSIDILPRADIGGGCIIAHGLGIVIGGTAVIGEDCTLLQGVTLGEARFDELDCPLVGDRVTLGARATLLGKITVGDDAVIGAGAVVLQDVPAGRTAVGVPARILG
ncbi:MAG: serine acetyltransferase [Acidobacteria bacterium]|nr:serine acetyltransferase [Acidobacteriota bacterium]